VQGLHEQLPHGLLQLEQQPDFFEPLNEPQQPEQ